MSGFESSSERDILAAGSKFLPQADYDFVQANVPITCVDLVPLSGQDADAQVGLILRETYGGATGWCLVGGRILHNEPLDAAVARHVKATLGPRMSCDGDSLALRAVFEYFSETGIGELHDPRKHAVALTYTATCHGPAEPTGEALEFRWYRRDQLPGLRFGFGQGKVLRRVLAEWDRAHEA